jgi:hypothetical protein
VGSFPARRDTSGPPICPPHAYVETRRPGQSCSPRLTPGVRAGSARAMATIPIEAGRDSAPLEPVPWPRGGLRLPEAFHRVVDPPIRR